MASFLTRALDLPPAEAPSGFTDTEGNTHAADIESLYTAGITIGCSTEPLRYCPNQPVTRGQMATFINRALGSVPRPPSPVTPSSVARHTVLGPPFSVVRLS